MDVLVDEVAWNADGLVPVIAQDAFTGDVLMLAWMNEEALALTLEERRCTGPDRAAPCGEKVSNPVISSFFAS